MQISLVKAAREGYFERKETQKDAIVGGVSLLLKPQSAEPGVDRK